jgi:hypothetical protein
VGLLMKKVALQQWHGLMTQALEDARMQLATTAAAARIQVCLMSSIAKIVCSIFTECIVHSVGEAIFNR